MKNNIETLVIAGAGVVSAEAADIAVTASQLPAEEAIKIFIQVVIGIATLVKMFKKPKTKV
jgi:hypothetical protein